ncbi:ATP-binding protein [Thalassomonas actiniarum]|uniref:histidine kinase n=1 Tax=Thalassomonas actiniarum TaxID=485447 RepID=A0AAE9YP21_9GAMM|nr:ATP-binding protein [Thalassomonas actiniarum]WDD98629.1 DUF3365 domain-containing protein [Thalassomonas actiniarum]
MNLFWRLLLPILLFGLLVSVMANRLIISVATEQVQNTSIDNAKIVSNLLTQLRAYYTANVIKDVQSQGLEISHDHRADKHVVPLPATMVHDISHSLNIEHVNIRLYSAYPFPWRRQLSGIHSETELQTWQQLEASPDKARIQFTRQNGQRMLQYSVADLMRSETCVNCHNNHPDSTKIDWQLGDLRGVLEISIPIEKALQSAYREANRASAIIAAALLLLVFLLHRIIYRKLLNPLRELQQASSQLKNGDLAATVNYQGNDEIGRLAQDYQALGVYLTTIRDGVTALGRGQLNADLASPAEQDEIIKNINQARRELALKDTKIKQRTSQLHQLNAYKRDFTANISHEFRSPLNSITLLTKKLACDPRITETPKLLTYCQTITSAADRLLAIVNNILDIAKIDAGDMEVKCSEFYIEELISNVIVPCEQALLAKKLDINIDISAKLLSEPVHSDPFKLFQIVNNLLTNAINFTDAGKITVKVTQECRPDDSQADAKSFIHLSVQDTGIGMAVEDVNQIFQDFTQLDASVNRKVEGVGLGLAVCNRMATLLEGYITVASEPGKGSCFTLIIPQKLSIFTPPAENNLVSFDTKGGPVSVRKANSGGSK